MLGSCKAESRFSLFRPINRAPQNLSPFTVTFGGPLPDACNPDVNWDDLCRTVTEVKFFHDIGSEFFLKGEGEAESTLGEG